MSDNENSDSERHTVNGTEVVQKENYVGVMKDHVEVPIGTGRVVVPRYIRNSTTDRREDLTRLSDDGYLKHYLALYWDFTARSSDIIDLGSAPVLSFDKGRFEYREIDGQHILVKREAESKFEEMVLETGDNSDTGSSQGNAR